MTSDDLRNELNRPYREFTAGPWADYVNPIYMALLNLRFCGLTQPKTDEFVATARQILMRVRPDDIQGLLTYAGWRGKLAASWLAGIKRWSQYADIVGALLCAPAGYAGPGYCFALACFCNSASAQHLRTYLDLGPNPDTFPTDDFRLLALSALLWIDEHNGSDYASAYAPQVVSWGKVVSATEAMQAWEMRLRKRLVFCQENFGLSFD